MMEFAGYAALGLGLGLFIYKKKILDFFGTMAASAIGVTIAIFAGMSWLTLLLIFLFLGYISTKYRYDFKARIRVAEKDHGRRNIINVLANGVVPTAFAVLWYLDSGNAFGEPLKAAYIAAVATVTGDTLSAEIGVLSRMQPRLITTLEKVPPGTHGGISVLGEVVGLGGTIIIGVAAWLLGLMSLHVALFVAIVGGAIGFHFDSILGALLERKKLIGNGTVNFLSSMTGALTGLLAAVVAIG